MDDYDAGTATICGSGLYLAGEDQLYAFIPAVSGLITVTLTSASAYVGLFLYEGCPAGGNCVSSAYSAGGNQTLQGWVTAGLAYFIVVDSWSGFGPNCHAAYDLGVTAPGPLPPPTTQDCFGAIGVCQTTYQELTSPIDEGNYPNEINTGISCLGSGEDNGLWYDFTVQSSGLLCFSITPTIMTDDYDWAVFDLTAANCSDIFSGTAPEVSCNFSANPGVTGANGLPGSQNEPCIPVTVGQSYALYVSNHTLAGGGYTLDFGIPGSTANIFDLTPPTIDTLLSMNCAHDSLVVQMSEFVLCATVQPTDFSITGPGGPYAVTQVASTICGAGGSQDNTFLLTVSPPLLGGAYDLSLVDDVEDLCGNIGNTGTISFTIDPLLGLNAVATGAGCNGLPGEIDGVAVGGTAPFTFDLNGTVQVNNGNYPNLAPGTYTLTLSDASGCMVDTVLDVQAVSTFMTNDSLVIDAGCFGSADGSIEIITNGNGGPWDYEWTDAGGNPVQSTTGGNGDVFTGGAGTYTVVIYEGPGGSGCTDTVSATIAQPAAILIFASNDTTICVGGSATLSASTTGGSPPVNFTWTSGLVGNGPHTVSPPSLTTYAVYAVDANGCHSDTLDMTVDLLDPLSVIVPDTVYGCANIGEPVNAVAAGGDGVYLYDWGSGPGPSSSTTVVLSSSTQLCVTLTDGCESPPASDCVWIDIQAPPPVILTVDSGLACAPFTVELSIVDTSGNADVDWDFGDGITTTALATVLHTYADAGSYDVTATVTWPNGCVSDTTIADLVTLLAPPIANFTWSPNPTTTLETLIQFVEQATPDPLTYAWDIAGLDTSSLPDPSYEFPDLQGGSYPVTLVVTNALGCTDSITLIVFIHDEFLVFVPNAFTPDGDGMNDLFYILGNDIDPEEYELQVFDRWGEVIFRTTDRYNAWIGTRMNEGGEVVQQDTYVWKLNCRSSFDKQKAEFVGSVTVVK